MALSAHQTSSNRSSWILDSGAMQHMSHDSNIFLSITPFNTNIITANGSMSSKGKGIVKVKYGSSNLLLKENIYVLSADPSKTSALIANTETKPTTDLQAWHLRLNHTHDQTIIKMQKTDSLPKFTGTSMPHCSACILGKSKRKPFPQNSTRSSTYVSELISSDIYGPFPPSTQGFRYFITFTDSFSCYSFVFLLKNKCAQTVVLHLQTKNGQSDA